MACGDAAPDRESSRSDGCSRICCWGGRGRLCISLLRLSIFVGMEVVEERGWWWLSNLRFLLRGVWCLRSVERIFVVLHWAALSRRLRKCSNLSTLHATMASAVYYISWTWGMRLTNSIREMYLAPIAAFLDACSRFWPYLKGRCVHTLVSLRRIDLSILTKHAVFFRFWGDTNNRRRSDLTPSTYTRRPGIILPTTRSRITSLWPCLCFL